MEHTVLETAPSTISERSKHKVKESRKRKSSAVVGYGNSQPDDISLQKISRSEGDLPSDDRKSNAVAESLMTEVTLSTIRQGKNRRRREKKRMAYENADSNCNPEDNCPQDKSQFGGDLSPSLTVAKCTQANTEVSNPQTKENGKEKKKDKEEKSHSSQGRESEILIDESCKIEIAPSALSNQSMEPNAKKRKKSKKRNSSISNADNNCNPDQVDAEVSNPQTENGKDGKERKMEKEGKSHSSQGSESDILNESCKIEIAPSALSNQSMVHNTKKRKKSKKKNSSISNADSIRNPDQADAEVSQLLGKESNKDGSSHIDREAADGIVSYDSNAASHNDCCASEDGNSHIASQSCNIEIAPSTICDQSKEQKSKKRKRKKSRKIDDSISNAESNCDPSISSTEKSISGGAAALAQSYVNLDVILPSPVLKEARRSKRKLLILDLNGLLADIVKKPIMIGYPNYKPHIRVGKNGVFKRPFCDDFIQFCLETFDVGVWSSRMRINVELIVNCLFGDRRNRLLLCWYGSHCTKTGCQTLENRGKPLVLKELKKLWEKGDPRHPWKEGDYDESNTLLIDDSPYKALCNPPYTGIFPQPYRRQNDRTDNSLGPNGDLRLYLERLALADNVQRFVAENPFGQMPITNSHRKWTFYSKIIDAINSGGVKSLIKKKKKKKSGVKSVPINPQN